MARTHVSFLMSQDSCKRHNEHIPNLAEQQKKCACFGIQILVVVVTILCLLALCHRYLKTLWNYGSLLSVFAQTQESIADKLIEKICHYAFHMAGNERRSVAVNSIALYFLRGILGVTYRLALFHKMRHLSLILRHCPSLLLLFTTFRETHGHRKLIANDALRSQT